jgi:transcriptional regulator with XRE-family HTH domain
MKTVDLQRFRKEKKLSQIDLAEILGCKQSFISRVEKGIRSLPENMMDILQSNYGNIEEYISEKEEDESVDGIVINGSAQDLLFTGADAFTRQIVKMMNEKLIAPYSMLAEKEREIERLNRQIGKLEAQLAASKKADAQEGGNVTFADAK